MPLPCCFNLYCARSKSASSNKKSKSASSTTKTTRTQLPTHIYFNNQFGGNTNLTGYTDGVDTSQNPMNIIPNGNISI